jgi:hypothetical protein
LFECKNKSYFFALLGVLCALCGNKFLCSFFSATEITEASEGIAFLKKEEIAF